MSLQFCKRWAGYLATKTGQPPEKEAILAFVIEIMFINLVNTGIMLSLGFIFDVLPGIITCMVTVAMLRFTAGGAHSSSPWRCTTISTLVFLSIAIVSYHLSPLNQLYIDIFAVLVITIGIILLFRHAPVESPSAPIISAHRRKKLKFLSLIMITLIAIVFIILRENTWLYAREVQITMLFCVLWCSFNLTHTAHQIMSIIDRISIQKKRG